MATSGNAWSQHFNPKATTPNPNIPPPQGGDSYSGNFSGGNNGGRESLDTMLDRIEAMMPNIDQERGYRALADLSNMKKKLDEMVKKRNTFEAQIKKQLGMA
ncbi:hypothetical protein EYR38_007397 [Pleurotus pulmonarius]|nr:hypothetical protein EYR38_007397 [Pleurotus pulmonarius]